MSDTTAMMNHLFDLQRQIRELKEKVEGLEKQIPRAIILPADQQVIWVEGFMNQLAELEKKVDSLDLEKKLKIDYMLKMNQLEKNDKAHQASYDKIWDALDTIRNRLTLLENLKK